MNKIRKATKQDIPAIVDLMAIFAKECAYEEKFNFPFNPDTVTTHVTYMIQSPQHLVLVDDEIEGLFIGIAGNIISDPSKFMLIEHIWYVRPEALNTGKGMALYREAVKKAKEANIKYLAFGHMVDFGEDYMEDLLTGLKFKPLETMYIKEVK
jgi:N-acetylglutamate synthase-like GNAT family acetyltransferase